MLTFGGGEAHARPNATVFSQPVNRPTSHSPPRPGQSALSGNQAHSWRAVSSSSATATPPSSAKPGLSQVIEVWAVGRYGTPGWRHARTMARPHAARPHGGTTTGASRGRAGLPSPRCSIAGAVLGAGSVQWTPVLVGVLFDILLRMSLEYDSLFDR